MKATDEMTFGKNELLNDKTKQVGLNHSLEGSKVSLPHSTVQKEQPNVKNWENYEPVTNEQPNVKNLGNYEPISPIQTVQQKWKKEEPTNSHDINKAASIILAAGVGWYLFR